MKAFVKWLFVVCLLLAVIFTAYFFRLPDASKQALLRDINLAIEQKRLPENMLRNWLQKALPETQIPSKPFPKITAARDTSGLNTQEYFQQAGCYKAPSKKLTSSKPSVYRWQDAKGRWHFSDQKPENGEDISNTLPDKIDYFTLNFTYHGNNLPAFFKDQTVSHVEQIYKFLAGFIPKNQLRQLTLNIQLFERPEDFERYRLNIAADAKTKSGFYSLRHNQAVVQQQKDDQATLAIALHEASHIIMASLFGQTPMWLNEGFAEFNERLMITGQQKQVKPSSYYWRLLSSKDAAIKLWDYDHKRFYQSDDQTLNYATSWALVYFLLQESPETFQAVLSQLLAKPCIKLDMPAIIAQHYPNYSRFLKDWHKWRKSQAPRNYYY